MQIFIRILKRTADSDLLFMITERSDVLYSPEMIDFIYSASRDIFEIIHLIQSP